MLKFTKNIHLQEKENNGELQTRDWQKQITLVLWSILGRQNAIALLGSLHTYQKNNLTKPLDILIRNKEIMTIATRRSVKYWDLEQISVMNCWPVLGILTNPILPLWDGFPGKTSQINTFRPRPVDSAGSLAGGGGWLR